MAGASAVFGNDGDFSFRQKSVRNLYITLTYLYVR